MAAHCPVQTKLLLFVYRVLYSFWQALVVLCSAAHCCTSASVFSAGKASLGFACLWFFLWPFSHTLRDPATLSRSLLQVTISCLINQISDLPPEHRRIPLAVIADRTKLSIDGVEFLLMKALALHLIEGSIDQVCVVGIVWLVTRCYPLAGPVVVCRT